MEEKTVTISETEWHDLLAAKGSALRLDEVEREVARLKERTGGRDQPPADEHSECSCPDCVQYRVQQATDRLQWALSDTQARLKAAFDLLEEVQVQAVLPEDWCERRRGLLEGE